MNFFTTPSLFGDEGVASQLKNRSLGGMAKTLGFTASAIAITAGHQIAVEEGRNFLTRWRATRSNRKDRNTSALCALLASDDIPIEVIRHLESQRDVFRAAIRLTLDMDVPAETREAVRVGLRDLYNRSRSQTG